MHIFRLQWFDIGKNEKSYQNLSKFVNFHKIQWKLSALQKSGQKNDFFGISEVLVGFCKKRKKIAHFIWEICTFSGLSKSIAHDFDRIGHDFIVFDGFLWPRIKPLENHKFDKNRDKSHKNAHFAKSGNLMKIRYFGCNSPK